MAERCDLSLQGLRRDLDRVMRVDPVSEAEAVAALPETFDQVEGEETLTDAEVEQAAKLLLRALEAYPNEHYFRIRLER
jgi:hypothetical protein